MLDQVLSISSSKIKVLRQFYRRSFEVKRQPFRDRSFILEEVGGGYNFLRGLILGVNCENAQNVRGVEILRHRAGLLSKSCQTIL